jgi:AmmeMemoRadiSam system protein A
MAFKDKKPAQAPHPLVRLAKQAVEAYVSTGKTVRPMELTPEMMRRAATFVCLKKGGELRGCIGTFEPTRANVAEETIVNAIASATRDPRFLPVEADELPELTYTVDVLTRPEPVDCPDELNPRRHGVIVECGPRRGLLLPDLEGVDTVDQQIEICRRKAGLSPDDPVKLYCFEVERYE